MKKICVIRTIFIIFIFLNTPCFAQPDRALILRDDRQKYDVGLFLEYLEDPAGELTIADVTSPEMDARFVKSDQKTPNFSYTKSAYWVRFRLQNKTADTDNWLLELGYALTHHIDFYLSRYDRPGRPSGSEQGFEVKQTGAFQPFDTRDMAYHNFVFNVPLKPESEKTVYIRIKTDAAMTLPLTVWSQEGFVKKAMTDQIIAGFFYGILVIMVFYNLFLFLALREKSYLYYVIYMVCMTLFYLSYTGYADQYLGLDTVWWHRFGLMFSLILGIIFLLKFSASFLETKVRMPKWHRLIQFLLALWIVCLLVGPLFGSYIPLLKPLLFYLLTTLLVVTLICSISWRRGYIPARYYLLANILLWASMLCNSLVRFAILPSNAITERNAEVGAVTMVLFFSLALADRINLLKQSLETTHTELEKHRDHLEEVVEARTAEVMDAKERAEAANLAKSVFLANMSHELRTPLNAILGYSQLMQRDASILPEQKEQMTVINRSGEHLLALIDDVLEISKIEAGKTALNIHTFDMRYFLRDMADMLESSAQKKGLRFEIIGIENVPRYVAADENKLRRILINILGNAIKFTEHGSVTMKVSCQSSVVSKNTKSKSTDLDNTDLGANDQQTTDHRQQNLRFEVEDTGIGIAEAEIGKVFDYFEQTASGIARKRGTGLGLAISRDFARMMGGDITVTSEVDKGSIFRLEIPIQESSASDILEEIRPRRVIGLEAGQEIPRILVAEDEDDSRRLLAKLLQMAGFDVREAMNGQEALKIFNQWHPHFIWMDIRMPVMDGLEATRCIKEIESGKSIPIAALTAHALEEEKEAILAAGCDDFVRKPFREQKIFDVMAEHLKINYLYEEETKEDAPVEADVELHLGQLAALPVDLRYELHQAVVELNTARTLELIEQAKKHDAHVAGILSTLANKLDYRGLLNLLEGTDNNMD